MYATCQQLQAHAQAHAAAASGLLGHTELRLRMPPSIAFATRGRLQGLRLQLALLDREFDDLGMVKSIIVQHMPCFKLEVEFVHFFRNYQKVLAEVYFEIALIMNYSFCHRL